MRVRTTVAVAALATATLATGGPHHAIAVKPTAKPARGMLFVEGDSLTVGSSSAIKASLRSDFRRIRVDAQVGRNTPTGVSRLNAGRKARAWVVALGTNDAPDRRTMRRHVKQVLRQADARPVLWVSVWRSPAYTGVNRMLSRLARRHDTLSVLRWDRYIRKHPRLLASDGIHLTSAGYQVRGRMIADAVRALVA